MIDYIRLTKKRSNKKRIATFNLINKTMLTPRQHFTKERIVQDAKLVSKAKRADNLGDSIDYYLIKDNE